MKPSFPLRPKKEGAEENRRISRRSHSSGLPLQYLCAFLCAGAILLGQFFYAGAMRPVFSFPSYLLLGIAGLVSIARLGRVHELREMDEKTNFETKIGLRRKAESRFGLSRKPILGQKAAFSRSRQIRGHGLVSKNGSDFDKAGMASVAALGGWLIYREMATPDVWLSATYFRLTLASLLIYLTLANLVVSVEARRFFLQLLLLGALAQGVLGIAQFMEVSPRAPQGWFSEQLRLWYEGTKGARSSGTYLNPNHLCWFLNAAGLISLSLGFLGRSKPWIKIAFLLAGTFFLGIALLTLSRGGFLGLAAGLAVLFGMGIRAFGFASRLRKPMLALSFCGALLIPAGSLWLIGSRANPVHQRFDQLLSDEYREDLWRVAGQQIQEEPVFGGGPGSFTYFSRRFRDLPAGHEDYYAHNDWLQMATDFGLPGLGLLLVAAGLHLHRGNRNYLEALHRLERAKNPQSNTAAITLGIVAASCSFAVHSFFDFNLQLPANALLAAALAGMLVSKERKSREFREEPASPFPRIAVTAVAPILGIALLISVNHSQTEWQWLQAENLMLKGRIDEAYLKAKTASGGSDRNPKLQRLLAEILMRQAATHASGILDSMAMLAEAEAALKKAVALAPQDRANYLRLAETLLRQGKGEEAIAVAAKVIELAPSQAQGYELCGMGYEEAGRLEEAERLYEKSLTLWNQKTGGERLKEVREKIKALAATKEGRRQVIFQSP